MFNEEHFTDWLCGYVANRIADGVKEYTEPLKQLKEDGDSIFELDMKARELEGGTETDVDRLEREINDTYGGSGEFSMGIASYLDTLDVRDICDIIIALGATDNWSVLADEGNSQVDSLADVAYWALDDYVLENLGTFVAIIRDILLGV